MFVEENPDRKKTLQIDRKKDIEKIKYIDKIIEKIKRMIIDFLIFPYHCYNNELATY